MEENIKKKNVMFIVFEIAVIIMGVVGITYATNKLLNDRTSTIVKVGEYGVDYVGDKEVTGNELEPIDDNLVNINSTENVLRASFKIKGTKENKDENLIFDVMLNEMNIDCSLLNKFTKWRLYKNGNLLSNGSLDPAFDGNVLTNTLTLTNTQEDLPKYNDEYDEYTFILWISEACPNETNCEMVDQSGIVGSNISMNIFVAMYAGAKTEYKRIPNLDVTCANKPELFNNMVAVTYKDGNWVVADETNNNRDYLWYDFNNAIWPNSVVVNTSKYSNVGEIINSSDIIAQYVWIPRFRYKLWNVEETVTDSYNAYENGINIIFESGLNKVSNDIKNNNYITHPAFGDNLKGLWISKYEISKDGDTYKAINGKEAYTNSKLDTFKTITDSLADSYLLGATAKSEMVNNLAWGATLYLSHSKYGVCSNGCASISSNNGYIAGENKQDTTTRNIYGVYDMAGSAMEYVLGESSVGSATSEVKLADGSFWYNGMSSISDREYLMRGGINRELFSFGDLSMDALYGSRSILISK